MYTHHTQQELGINSISRYQKHHVIRYCRQISDIVGIDITPNNIRCITAVISYSVIIIWVFDITLSVMITRVSTISQSDLFPEVLISPRAPPTTVCNYSKRSHELIRLQGSALSIDIRDLGVSRVCLELFVPLRSLCLSPPHVAR